MNRFESKVAIVTGAAQGIGEAYARALAAEGASVVVADVSDKGAAVADDIKGRYVRTDVSDPASVTAMASAAVEAYGGIDYLVNNAARLPRGTVGLVGQHPIRTPAGTP
jgi:3-oxoacyl-[acyl-carrier protein] reductase